MSTPLENVALVIPSFCPPAGLPAMVERFISLGLTQIIVVNDGSPEVYDETFLALTKKGVTVLTLNQNSGKGSALKHAYKFFLEFAGPDFILTCDDDGQHDPEDVLKLALAASPTTKFLLGVRSFGRGVPWKSLIGNQFMRGLFFLKTGRFLRDTQTGLRCIHRDLLPSLLQCRHTGFNFEAKGLVDLILSGEKLREIPIKTIYHEKNRLTRFDGVRDSYKVVASLLSN